MVNIKYATYVLDPRAQVVPVTSICCLLSAILQERLAAAGTVHSMYKQAVVFVTAALRVKWQRAGSAAAAWTATAA